MELGQIVKKTSKYLYRALPNAYNYTVGANTSKVKMFIYVVDGRNLPPELYGIFYNDPSTSDKFAHYFSKHRLLVEKVIIDVDLATYSDKIRLNVIEQSPLYTTLGHKTYRKECNQQDFRNIVEEDVLKYLNEV